MDNKEPEVKKDIGLFREGERKKEGKNNVKKRKKKKEQRDEKHFPQKFWSQNK